MLKSLPALIVVVTAAFGLALPVAAQTNDETSQQRPTEATPVCLPPATATLETTTPGRTLTVYNPVTAASTPSLTFYNPVAYPRPPLTYYTPLGQIDPPIRTLPPPSTPRAETVQSAPAAASSQPSMPATQTIPAPGACPPGTQVERLTP